MAEGSSSTVSFPGISSKDVLSDVLRHGAQRMLAQAIEAEVEEWIDGHAEVTDLKGRRQGVHKTANVLDKPPKRLQPQA